MKYYVIRVQWSQSDWEHVIVQASSKEAALEYMEEHWRGWRSLSVIATSTKLRMIPS